MKKHIFSLLIALLALFFPLLGCSIPVATGSADTAAVAVPAGGEIYELGASQKYLDVPAYKQARGTWCWAAADLMMWDYFDRNPHLYQSDIVRMVIGKVRNTPEGVSPGLFLKANGIDYKLVYTPVSQKVLIDSINQGKPLIARTANLDGTGAHILVIEGYYSWVANNTRYLSVSLIDPADGHRKSYNYDYLVKSSARQWTCTWSYISD